MYQQNNNAILHKLFRKSELSWAFSDTSKAAGPIVDLMFISLFIGASGVTVMGYISPLIMLLGFIGMCIGNGSRNKVSAMLGAGNIEEANKVFSASVVMGGGIVIYSNFDLHILFGSLSRTGSKRASDFRDDKAVHIRLHCGASVPHIDTDSDTLSSDGRSVRHCEHIINADHSNRYSTGRFGSLRASRRNV